MAGQDRAGLAAFDGEGRCVGWIALPGTGDKRHAQKVADHIVAWSELNTAVRSMTQDEALKAMEEEGR